MVIQIKALACELPSRRECPLARWSMAELAAEARRSGLVATISDTTVGRWLDEDAIRPWRYRSWIFPPDPAFAWKAGRILDLYEGTWEGEPLGPDDYVLSADEKTSLQARRCKHPTLPPRPGSPMKVEHEYERRGAWAYLTVWDVHRARVLGRCERKTGIEPFARVVAQVIGVPPYRKARRAFWIVDNGSSHRGEASVQRIQGAYPNLVLVHTPVHASWLNQIEIHFSIVTRKVLTPNDFPDLDAVAHRLSAFERHYERMAQPFQWTFTRRDLARLLAKLDSEPTAGLPAAA